jgi:cytochrome b
VLSLLSFRIAWGFVGGHWSRFSTFLYKPSALLAYVRGHPSPEHTVGHSPLGALSVFSLFAFLLFQVLAGLFSDDEISNSGPLTALAPSAWVSLLTFYHASVGKFVVLVLVFLHIGAIFFYRFKRKEDLISAMLTGYKFLDVKVESTRDNMSSWVLAACIFMGCAAAVAGLLYWAA